MKNKDKLIIKICKSVIVVFGVLTVFNVIMLVNKKSYALFQRTVETDKVIHIETASKFPSDNNGSLDELKEKTSDGIKGVDPEKGEECTKDCKEYRYSGTNVNNYVYFNCEPKQEQNNSTCEKWRIVGIFTDESNAEHLKIVRDNILPGSIMPATYTIGGIEYKINTGSGDSVYWNSEDKNDWAKAGLQYWLNTDNDSSNNKGYLNYLKNGVVDLIETTKYYLGMVTAKYQQNSASTEIVDSPKEAYANERTDAATWEGKIGLLYLSDYGFSADSSNWDMALYNYENASNSSWLQQGANHDDYEWLLSPSGCPNCGTVWSRSGYVSLDGVDLKPGNGVRPTLYLKSNVEISGGTGEATNPYTLILN